MSLLDKPEAQALLNDATLTADAIRGCADRLTGFLQRYLPHFYRAEQRDNATHVIRGLISGPGAPVPCGPAIAERAVRPGRAVQHLGA